MSLPHSYCPMPCAKSLDIEKSAHEINFHILFRKTLNWARNTLSIIDRKLSGKSRSNILPSGHTWERKFQYVTMEQWIFESQPKPKSASIKNYVNTNMRQSWPRIRLRVDQKSLYDQMTVKRHICNPEQWYTKRDMFEQEISHKIQQTYMNWWYKPSWQKREMDREHKTGNGSRTLSRYQTSN